METIIDNAIVIESKVIEDLEELHLYLLDLSSFTIKVLLCFASSADPPGQLFKAVHLYNVHSLPWEVLSLEVGCETSEHDFSLHRCGLFFKDDC